MTKAKFAYTQDDLGRVTQTAKTGEVFNRYGNGTEGLTTCYGYDDRSQLASEVTKVGTGATVLTGRNDSSYAYDTIGNRSTVTHNGNTATYTSGAVNQYTQRTVPGYFDVAGSDTAGTVTVAKAGGPTDTATRHGNYFFDAYGLTNTNTPVFASLTITGSGTATLPAYVEKTPQAMTYDDDGNLLSDGRWNYAYDGENRPVTAETTTAAIAAGVTREKLTLGYDYLGRRMVKGHETDWNSGTAAYDTCDLWNRHLYNGWNLVAVVDGNDTNLPITGNYYWGLDLSGSIGGAGGVGGLLMTQEGGNTYLPAYDAMGNVHAMMTAANVTLGGTNYVAGDIVAAYEYDAFGNTLRESGPYAASNPFRFSTKYTDIETGLIYHDTRYYSPSLGRFITRDSIGEQGGLNLYAYVSNRVPNAWDYLGMDGFMTFEGNFDIDGVWRVRAYEDGPSALDLRDANIFMANMSVTSSAAVPTDANGRMVGYTSMGTTSYESIMARNYRQTVFVQEADGTASAYVIGGDEKDIKAALAKDKAIANGALVVESKDGRKLFGLGSVPSNTTPTLGFVAPRALPAVGPATETLGTRMLAGAISVGNAALAAVAFLATPNTAHAPAPEPQQFNFDSMLQPSGQWGVYYRYTNEANSFMMQGFGLQPGSYLTDRGDYSSWEAFQKLALFTIPTVVTPVVITPKDSLAGPMPVYIPNNRDTGLPLDRTGGGSEWRNLNYIPPQQIAPGRPVN